MLDSTGSKIGELLWVDEIMDAFGAHYTLITVRILSRMSWICLFTLSFIPSTQPSTKYSCQRLSQLASQSAQILSSNVSTLKQLRLHYNQAKLSKAI